MSKFATRAALVLSLSSVFAVNSGCEEIKIEHDTSAMDATEVQIAFYDPVTHEYEQTDIFTVKNVLGCYKKVNEFFSHSSIMQALCYNNGHIVAIIKEEANGNHKVTLYPKGLFGKGQEQPTSQP